MTTLYYTMFQLGQIQNFKIKDIFWALRIGNELSKLETDIHGWQNTNVLKNTLSQKTLFQVKFSNKYQTPNKYMEGGDRQENRKSIYLAISL